MKLSPSLTKAIESLVPEKERQAFLDNAIESALSSYKKSKSDVVEIYVDGGSRGNPGPAGGGFAIYANGKLAIKGSVAFGDMTNNQAEYLALREALRKAFSHYPEAKVRCFMDSQLVVEQMNGNFKVKSANIKALHQEVYRIAGQFTDFTISHIAREKNKLADKLANEAMDRG